MGNLIAALALVGAAFCVVVLVAAIFSLAQGWIAHYGLLKTSLAALGAGGALALVAMIANDN